MQQGIIKRLIEEKWYGFISLDSGKDIFFHASEMQGGYDSFKWLQEWMEVEFEIVDGKNWQKKAVNVNFNGSASSENIED